MSEANLDNLDADDLKLRNKILDESIRLILNEIEKLDLHCECEPPCACLTKEQHLLLSFKHHIYGTFMQIDHQVSV